MMRMARWIVVLACTLAAGNALAAPPKRRPTRQPTPAAEPASPTPDKLDAKALMQSGLKLYAAKDFLGALAVFRDAYERFPSAKILLNIGTTLTKLDRKAEAANVYQRYLASSDSDPAKQGEVKRVLAELDAAVATLELSVTPADAEVQINDEDWAAAASLDRHRVPAGSVTVRARHPAYKPGEQVVRGTAGTRLPITIALVEIPPPPAPIPVAAVDSGLRAGAAVESPRAQIGAIALAHVDIANRGGAGLVGVTVDVTGRLQAQAAAILGPAYGGYAGASFAVLDGRLRPLVSAGIPIFVSSGARIAVRGAGGVELAVNRHLAVIAELGVEYFFNPEADVKRTLFIPAIGATGRL
jgi:hypothetical protein